MADICPVSINEGHFWVKDGKPWFEHFAVFHTWRGQRWPHEGQMRIAYQGDWKTEWMKTQYYCAKCREIDIIREDFEYPEDYLNQGYAIADFTLLEYAHNLKQPEFTRDEYLAIQASNPLLSDRIPTNDTSS